MNSNCVAEWLLALVIMFLLGMAADGLLWEYQRGLMINQLEQDIRAAQELRIELERLTK